MTIFAVPGITGQIKTTHLPSGDMAVSGPGSGPLEQIIYEVCHWNGRRNAQYGGWIIPHGSASKVLTGR